MSDIVRTSDLRNALTANDTLTDNAELRIRNKQYTVTSYQSEAPVSSFGLAFRAITRSSQDRKEFKEAKDDIRRSIASEYGETTAQKFDQTFSSGWKSLFGTPLTKGALIKFLDHPDLVYHRDVETFRSLRGKPEQQLDFILNRAGAKMKECFLSTIESTFNGNNLDCYKAILDYKKSPSKEKAQTIFDTYIKPKSDEQINLSGGEQTTITTSFNTAMKSEENPPPDLFDFEMGRAASDINRNIFTDTQWSSFVKSIPRSNIPTISFGESQTSIPSRGEWKLTKPSKLLNEKLKDHCSNSTNKTMIEENLNSAKRDYATRFSLSFNDLTNKDMTPEETNKTDGPRNIKADEILTSVSETRFPDNEAKATALKNDLMAISGQGLLAPIAASFSEKDPELLNGIFVNGNLQKGAECNYSLAEENQIKIFLTGTLNPANPNNVILTSSQFKNNSDCSTSHTAKGTLNMELIATVAPETGHITNLTCQSASGSWDIGTPLVVQAV
ncbi:MAG: hypothetical protein ACH346_03995 [Chthoniobacterales bacterium]